MMPLQQPATDFGLVAILLYTLWRLRFVPESWRSSLSPARFSHILEHRDSRRNTALECLDGRFEP